MKTRTNYVSNSSSSSYIVPIDLTDKRISCIHLTKDQIESISKSIDSDDLDLFRTFSDYWLTRPIKEYEADSVYDALESVSKVPYSAMQMCGEPYDEDQFFCYNVSGDSVYLSLQDIKGEIITRKSLCKLLREKFTADQKFILNFSNNSIILDINKEY